MIEIAITLGAAIIAGGTLFVKLYEECHNMSQLYAILRIEILHKRKRMSSITLKQCIYQ